MGKERKWTAAWVARRMAAPVTERGELVTTDLGAGRKKIQFWLC